MKVDHLRRSSDLCGFAVQDTTTYAAAVVAASRLCPSQVEDDHLRRSSGRCEQVMPGRKLKTTTYAAAVVAASRRCLVANQKSITYAAAVIVTSR